MEKFKSAIKGLGSSRSEREEEVIRHGLAEGQTDDGEEQTKLETEGKPVKVEGFAAYSQTLDASSLARAGHRNYEERCMEKLKDVEISALTSAFRRDLTKCKKVEECFRLEFGLVLDRKPLAAFADSEVSVDEGQPSAGDEEVGADRWGFMERGSSVSTISVDTDGSSDPPSREERFKKLHGDLIGWFRATEQIHMALKKATDGDPAATSEDKMHRARESHTIRFDNSENRSKVEAKKEELGFTYSLITY